MCVAAPAAATRVGYVPAWMLLRGLSCKRPGHVWHARSGARVVSAHPRHVAAHNKDRLLFLGLATLARERGRVLRGDPREVGKLCGADWSLRVARERLERVAFSVLYLPTDVLDCPCRCQRVSEPMRVADDYRYCTSSRTFRLLLSESFMHEAADGAPVCLDTVAGLQNHPTALDLYCFYSLRAHRGDRVAVPMFGDSGVSAMLEIAKAKPKARQSIQEREALLGTFWSNMPYRYDRDHEAVVCDRIDPAAALAEHLGAVTGMDSKAPVPSTEPATDLRSSSAEVAAPSPPVAHPCPPEPSAPGETQPEPRAQGASVAAPSTPTAPAETAPVVTPNGGAEALVRLMQLASHPAALAALGVTPLPQLGTASAQAFQAMGQELAQQLAALLPASSPEPSPTHTEPDPPVSDGIRHNIRFLVPRRADGERTSTDRYAPQRSKRKRRRSKARPRTHKRGPPDEPT